GSAGEPHDEAGLHASRTVRSLEPEGADLVVLELERCNLAEAGTTPPVEHDIATNFSGQRVCRSLGSERASVDRRRECQDRVLDALAGGPELSNPLRERRFVCHGASSSVSARRTAIPLPPCAPARIAPGE